MPKASHDRSDAACHAAIGNAANEVEAASIVLRGAPLPVAIRIVLWIGVQPVVAGLMIASGAVPAGQALNAAAGCWIIYAGVVNLGTLVSSLG